MNEAARAGIAPRAILLGLNLYTSEDVQTAVPPDPVHSLPGGITAATWESWFHTWLRTLTWDEMPYLQRAIAAAPEWTESEDIPQDGPPDQDAEIIDAGAIACELSLQLLDDDAIHQLNATYRQVDRPTDVLAFAALENPLPLPLPEPEAIADPLDLGDIAISLDTAARQADERGHPLTVELAWLAAHGLLHLLGWDHPDAESLAAMLACQDRLLRAIALTAAV